MSQLWRFNPTTSMVSLVCSLLLISEISDYIFDKACIVIGLVIYRQGNCRWYGNRTWSISRDSGCALNDSNIFSLNKPGILSASSLLQHKQRSVNGMMGGREFIFCRFSHIANQSAYCISELPLPFQSCCQVLVARLSKMLGRIHFVLTADKSY